MPEEAKTAMNRRVLSGMRPTGKLHIGHYVGALENWVKLQQSFECFFFVADWHALTTDYADTSRVKANIFEMVFDWLAAGLDPERATIFIQSHVPQHAELHLLLSMMTPLGWLERVPTYKDQKEQLKEKDLNTYGFLGYPLLQSADILLYKASWVPVGEDQVAHVEITREIARRFNQFYPRRYATTGLAGVGPIAVPISVIADNMDESATFPSATTVSGTEELGSQVLETLAERRRNRYVFPEPQPLLTHAPKLPGTDGRKMSKSYGNSLLLSDPEPELRKKLKTMVTDPARIRRTDPGNPDICPVGDLHKIFSSEETRAKVREGCTTAGIGCIECKGWVADNVVAILAPMQERRRKYEENPKLAWDILEAGSARARKAADETLGEAREAMRMSLDYQPLQMLEQESQSKP